MARLAVEADREIYYEHHEGSGRPVVLSHGWGMSGRAWDGILPALLANGNAVVSYDHRGCGASDKDFRDVSIESLGQDVVALCEALDLNGVVLNGWSLGGAIVVDAAAKLGARLGGLVSTVGATPRYTQADGWPHGGTADVVEATVGALQADRATFLHGLYYDAVFAADVPDPVKAWVWDIAMQAGPNADSALAALAEVDHRDIMANLDVPALVFVGGKDQVVDPETGRRAAEILPRARLIEYQDSGHAPFLEEPDRYRTDLVEFLNEVG